MTKNFYVVLFMLWTMIYCVVRPDPKTFERTNLRTVNRNWRKSQENDLQSADIIKNVEKRDVSDPLQNAGEQLSIFNSLLNSVILAESIGQNSTTFGEIGVNFMLVQNIPTDENGISSIDSKNIHMENTGDIHKIMENGFDGKFSLDVIENLMMIEEGISAFDDLSETIGKIVNVKTKYRIFGFLDFDDYTETLQFLDTLPKVASSISRLSNGSTLIDSFKMVAKLIKHYESINVEAMRRSYESCKISISSQNCSSGFEVLRNITVSEDSIKNFEAAAVFLNFMRSADHLMSLDQILYERELISPMHEQFSQFQLFFGTSGDFESQLKKFSNMFVSLAELKNKNLELQKIAKTLENFRPVSDAIVRMRNEHQVHSQKRIKNTNEYSTDVIDTIRRLPGGIVSLDHLLEKTRKSEPPPNKHINSKVVERMKIMDEFTTQRVDFLKFSDGVGSVHHISTIIRNTELFLNQAANYTWLEEEVKIILQENNRLASVENVTDGIIALKDVEIRLNSLNKENWAEFINAFMDLGLVPYHEKVFSQRFSKLASVVRLAKEVDNLIKTNGKADDKIFSEAIDAAEKLSDVIKNNENEPLIVKDHQLESTKNLVKFLNQMKFSSESGEVDIEYVITGLRHATAAHKDIQNIIPTLSSHSRFASGFTDLQKLKTGVKKRPSQKKLNAFKPMMTQLNSLKKLEISSAHENNKLSPHLTNLVNCQNSDLLGDVSKGLNQYRRLIKGIESVESLQREKVEAPIKKLLDGVEAIQILVAEDEISAYSVFYNSKFIDEQLAKLVKYIETTVKSISSNGLRVTITEKANSSHVHEFLSRLDEPSSTSISDMRRSMSVILEELENQGGCESDNGLFWKIIIGIGILIFVALCLFGVWLFIRSKKLKRRNKQLSPSVNAQNPQKVPTNGENLPVSVNAGTSPAAVSSENLPVPANAGNLPPSVSAGSAPVANNRQEVRLGAHLERGRVLQKGVSRRLRELFTLKTHQICSFLQCEQKWHFLREGIVLDKINNPFANEVCYFGSKIEDIELAPSEITSTDDLEKDHPAALETGQNPPTNPSKSLVKVMIFIV